MDFWGYLLILITGFAAGIVNTTAAGGSLLTLPVLIFLGLPAAVANGTNRVAIMGQSLSSISVFKRKGMIDMRLAVLLSLPALAGCLWGARIAIDISDLLFRRVLAVVLVAVLGITLWDPARNFRQPLSGGWKEKLLLIAAFFFIGLYGGFIMAGVGFFIIAALSLITGLDLVRSNGQKIFIIGVFNILALMIFSLNARIDWASGLMMAAGQGIGGWVGSHLAIKKGENMIRAFLTVTVIAMAVKLSGIMSVFF